MPRDIIGAIKYRYRNIYKLNESISGFVVLPINGANVLWFFFFSVNDKRRNVSRSLMNKRNLISSLRESSGYSIVTS